MKKYLPWIVHGVGVLIGGFLGWLYWAKIGCLDGSCPIWSNMWISTGYGALLGFFIAGLIPLRKKRKDEEEAAPDSPN